MSVRLKSVVFEIDGRDISTPNVVITDILDGLNDMRGQGIISMSQTMVVYQETKYGENLFENGRRIMLEFS